MSALFKSLKEGRKKKENLLLIAKKQTPAGAVFQSVNRLPFVVADPGSIFLGTASGFLGIVVFWEGTKARIFCENSWWIFDKKSSGY